MSALYRVAVLTATVVTIGGCASSNGSHWTSSDAPLPPYQEQTTVLVENNNWSDIVVYAVHHSTRYRLGMITSMNQRRFDLPRSVSSATGTIELLAEPIGSRERFLTGPLNVHQGQQVQLRLENQLPISTWSIW